MVLLRLTGLGEGLKLSPWASLANAAILKELYNGRSLFGAKGKGTTLSEVDYGAASCRPVVPILRKPDFMSNTFFNLFSSWWLVPPLGVWGVAPFHVINIASPEKLDQQKFLLVTIDFIHLGRRYWLMRRARTNI